MIFQKNENGNGTSILMEHFVLLNDLDWNGVTIYNLNADHMYFNLQQSAYRKVTSESWIHLQSRYYRQQLLI